MTERILREIQRRMYDSAKRGEHLAANIALGSLADWLKSQPPTEAGELVKEARAYTSKDESHLFLIERLADALEAAESLIAPMRKVLDDEQAKRIAADAKVAALTAQLESLREEILEMNERE